jgi:hypothetical protein
MTIKKSYSSYAACVLNGSSGREPALTVILAPDSWILNSVASRLLKASQARSRLLKPILTIIFYFFWRFRQNNRISKAFYSLHFVHSVKKFVSEGYERFTTFHAATEASPRGFFASFVYSCPALRGRGSNSSPRFMWSVYPSLSVVKTELALRKMNFCVTMSDICLNERHTHH